MRYLSVCSGIEAVTVAWHGLGNVAYGDPLLYKPHANAEPVLETTIFKEATNATS